MSAEIIYGETGEKLAIVLRGSETSSETVFFSDTQDSMQLGLIRTDKKRGIPRHRHLDFERKLSKTSEFVLVRKGSCHVSLQMLITDKPQVISLVKGDGILLLDGIHGFDSLEDELILMEVKQGPYAGNLDKELL